MINNKQQVDEMRGFGEGARTLSAGVAAHFAKGPVEWPGMAQIGDLQAKYGVFMEAGACTVFTNLGDKMK